MHLKKLLLALSLLSTSIVCSAAKEQPDTSLPVTEQPAPEQPAPTPEPPLAPNPLEAPPPELNPLSLPSSKEMTTSYESAFVRMLVTILGLVFLVFATFWILRKLGKGKFKMGSSRTINVLERRALSPKSMLYIVEIGNKKVLLCESQLQVRTLTSFEELPEEIES
ncbi:MAG: flagellar biosynthetic protein FliO [Rhabdochlamydiaceae bacterium]|jgi:flagellar biogenesis protein FliO